MKLLYLICLAFVAVLYSGCLDQEEDGYLLDLGTYTIEGEFLKNCEGDPMSNTSLRLLVRRSNEILIGNNSEILATGVTDQFGKFSMSYTDSRRYSNSSAYQLWIQKLDENNTYTISSIPLTPYKNSKVNLIDEFGSKVLFLITGANNLTSNDTLILMHYYERINVLGPFYEGRVVDSINNKNFTGVSSLTWAIGDTNFLTGNRYSRHPGNYGSIQYSVDYCSSDTVYIDLSNTLK